MGGAAGEDQHLTDSAISTYDFSEYLTGDLTQLSTGDLDDANLSCERCRVGGGNAQEQLHGLGRPRLPYRVIEYDSLKIRPTLRPVAPGGRQHLNRLLAKILRDGFTGDFLFRLRLNGGVA